MHASSLIHNKDGFKEMLKTLRGGGDVEFPLPDQQQTKSKKRVATHAPSVGVVGAAGGAAGGTAGGGAAGGAAGGAGSNKYDLAIQQHGKERTCPLCNELCQERNGSDWVELGEHM